MQAANPIGVTEAKSEFAKIWDRRNLILLLASTEIKLRYKQSLLGGLWAVVRPVMLMLVFTYLFGTLAKLDSAGIPYPAFVFAALIAWDLFANIVQGCTTSVTSHKKLVEKLYCPRLLFPLSSVAVALFDFAIALCVLGVLACIWGMPLTLNILWLPLLVIGIIIAGLSVGLWLAAITVWLRDMKFAVAYLLQVMLLLTPVGYGAAAVPQKFSFIVDLNPLSALIQGFRWSLLGAELPKTDTIVLSITITTILLGAALWFFTRIEKTFADVI